MNRRIVAVVLVAIVGLFVVKWSPYFAKALSASVHHSIGSSTIIAGSGASVGAASALAYARDYYTSVWKALVLAFVLGATIQTLLPWRTIESLLTRNTKGTLAATSLALAGMMCTCCAAPIAISLRGKRAAPGATLAFWLGNPLLNPAVMFFIAFVISWKFAILRMVLGALLLVSLAAYAN